VFVASPIETITYSINPKAVWSDGVPITCDDFAYTVDQQQNGTNLYDPTGYTDIAKVDCTDEHKPVVTYAKGKTFANWKQLFGASAGIFPSHILKGKDRDKLMKNGYTWSGGPWMMQKWNKGQDLTLVPNPKYWGPQPHLAKVVFKFVTDTAAEFQDLKSGQVDAIYPQPEVDTVNDIAAGGLTDINTAYNSNTATVEGLWMNNEAFPFDTVPFRQAVSYAIDRAALVQKLFGPLGVTSPSNSLNPYAVKDYSDQNSFAHYKLDLTQVNTIMTGAGWAKGGDGIWAKGGKRAAFSVDTTAGDKRRELTEDVLQQQLKAAGFDMSIKNEKSDDLFNTTLPNGAYQLSIYGSGLTFPTPGLCSTLCSANIPTDANGRTGNNTTRTNIKGLDSLLQTVDNSLDDSARKAAAFQADGIIAENVASLPLDPLPDILLWNKKVVGPIQDNSIEGMFWNLDQWGVTS
jgi:peptide/nickel transport system substrate-binding protein